MNKNIPITIKVKGIDRLECIIKKIEDIKGNHPYIDVKIEVAID